jgi:central kinetochore subunit Mis15/CHL4
MARISVPTTARLPSTLRLDSSSSTVWKHLNRLNRASLLALVLDWLDHNNAPICAPYLRDSKNNNEDDDPADLYPPLSSLEELRDLYSDMQTHKGSKREVIDRIVEGDWRHGLTLYQLSMADLQHLYQNPTSQKWSAYQIMPLKTPTPQQAAEEVGPPKVDATSLNVPRFHPSTFLQNLQAQVLPDVKSHYSFDRPKDLALLLLRIFILDSPYNTKLATSGTEGDASRTIHVAFPDGSPHIYVSKPQSIGLAASSETKSLYALVLEGISKALSRPRQRYTLKPTSLNTKNLHELLCRRGPGRTNSAGGGWSIYTDEKKKESPLGTLLPSPPLSEQGDRETVTKSGQWQANKGRVVSPDSERYERRVKRARLVAQARFGDSAKIDDGRGVERFDVVMNDPFNVGTDHTHNDGQVPERESNAPASRSDHMSARRSMAGKAVDRVSLDDDEYGGGDDSVGGDGDDGKWCPNIKLTFYGPHVFAGVRQLVEAGIIDGEKMPAWLTGEEGVTIGVVRHGRIRGNKGTGV